MTENRPRDWDWVRATYNCSALVMFGELKALARANVQTRNEQLGHDRFLLMESDGISFSVGRPGDFSAQVWFKVQGDLAGIAVAGYGGNNEVTYRVGLDGDGQCKLRRESEQLDPWQVLKAHLEPLLFSAR